MALRDFTDSQGVVWTAWDIPPSQRYQPPRKAERRVTATAGYTPERRTTPDRRRRGAPPQLLYGWVCFECEDEKRRLVRPPPAWDRGSDADLEVLCARATPNPRPKMG